MECSLHSRAFLGQTNRQHRIQWATTQIIHLPMPRYTINGTAPLTNTFIYLVNQCQLAIMVIGVVELACTKLESIEF